MRHRHHQLPSALALALLALAFLALALLALVCVDLLNWMQQLQAELLSNQPTRSVYRANGTTVDHLVYMRSRSHVDLYKVSLVQAKCFAESFQHPDVSAVLIIRSI